MPYVNVWVDDPECDGNCDAARERYELRARIDEAERHLRAGDAAAALHALTDDAELGIKPPGAIAAAYAEWKRGYLPGFTNYRRTESQETSNG